MTGCRDCGVPLSRWSVGGRCRSCARALRWREECVSRYREDMELLAFLREGGSQMEWALRKGITRARVSQQVRQARRRVGEVERMMREGDPLADPLVLGSDT